MGLRGTSKRVRKEHEPRLRISHAPCPDKAQAYDAEIKLGEKFSRKLVIKSKQMASYGRDQTRFLTEVLCPVRFVLECPFNCYQFAVGASIRGQSS